MYVVSLVMSSARLKKHAHQFVMVEAVSEEEAIGIAISAQDNHWSLLSSMAADICQEANMYARFNQVQELMAKVDAEKTNDKDS